MNTTNNGGPAFPADPDWLEPGTIEGSKRVAHGMSLRDYFAAQAINGCLPGKCISNDCVDDYAGWAYRMADAMLRARDR